MKEMIKEELKDNEKELKSKKKISAEVLNTKLEIIKFVQHERLIHLLITIMVIIIAIIVFTVLLINPSILLCIVFLIFVVLVSFYLAYYYFLENSIQKLYQQYLELKRKKDV